MNIREIILSVVGVMLILFGSLMLTGFFASDNHETLDGTIGLIVMLVVVPLGLGGWLFQKARTDTRKRRDAETESLVLKTAMELRGVISPVELALKANIPIEKADKLLQEMQYKGFAEVKVNEKGALYYEFQNLLR